MFWLRKLVLISLMMLAAVPCASAEELTAEKKADIQQLLQLTGSLSLGRQMAAAFVAQMTQALKRSRPDIPQAIIDGLPEDVNSVIDENIGSFEEAVISTYHKYFTDADIKEMIRFYSGPLGRKTIEVMPALLQESMSQGQAWGRSLGPQIEAKIRQRCKSQGIDI